MQGLSVDRYTDWCTHDASQNAGVDDPRHAAPRQPGRGTSPRRRLQLRSHFKNRFVTIAQTSACMFETDQVRGVPLSLEVDLPRGRATRDAR